MNDRYPYRHHGPAVHGSKLADYLISEANMRYDEIKAARALLREAAAMLAEDRDALAAGIGINGALSDDPEDQPARDAIAAIDDWTARAGRLLDGREWNEVPG